jgi:signal transduction histidine kinase
MHMALLLIGHVWLPITNAVVMPFLAMPAISGLRLAITRQFLNFQLDKLSDGPRLALPEPADLHPPMLLQQLKTLFHPRGWLLTSGQRKLTDKELSSTEIPENLATGRWSFNDNRAWIRLQRGDNTYHLGLILPDDLNREMIQQYLQRLHLENGPSAHLQTQKRSRPTELFTARLERVQLANQNLARLHGFIRHSFEHMPDGIIVTDQRGIIRFANGHIERWFNEPMPSLFGLPLTRLLNGHNPEPAVPWHDIVSDTLIVRQGRTTDLSILSRDFLIHFAPFRLPDSDQHGIVANISDISELREQQRQHREAIDFISHDVRSPLVSQLALIEQLKRRGPGQIQAEELEQLGKLARRSYHLAEEFVQLARAEQLTEARFYECELLAIVENARDSVIEQAIVKRIQIYLQGTEDLWLRGNPELLERAVINLIGNAIKYSEAESQIIIQVFRADHLACLAIADEGNGIDANELPGLFDRFQRQKRSELSGNYGTGLGLSFVKTVVEKHRGNIIVSSSPGIGSTFTIKLPLTSPLP